MLGLGPFGYGPFGTPPDSADFAFSETDPLATVSFNGRTARSLGFKVAQVLSWLDTPQQDFPTVQAVGVQGALHSDERPRVATADIRVVGTVVGSSAADARDKRDRLINVVRNSPVLLILPDSLTRYVRADLASVHIDPVGASFVQSKLPIELALKACDPFRYDLYDSTALAAAGVNIRCRLGNAPVGPLLQVAGPATNPLISAFDYLGSGIGSMQFTGLTLLAGDTLVVDCKALTAKKNGVSIVTQLLTGDFLQLDPAIHADRANAAWPYLTCSSGVMTVRYQRAWT